MWEAFKEIIFWTIDFFYQFSHDWGLAIILITIIFRLVLMPLMIKQTKSSFQMQKIQPLISEIQTKFKDDPVRLQEESQKLYAEAKFNPIAGCLPMIIQMPIFIALFQVLNEMGERTSGTSYEFYWLVPDLVMRPAEAFAIGFGTFIPYLILMIIFAFATFLPMILQQRNNTGQQRNQMMLMAAVMSVMMLFFSWNAPAGVLLFWGTSSVIALAQQQLTMRHLRKKDRIAEETAEAKPIEVEVTRKAKKPKPTKKSK